MSALRLAPQLMTSGWLNAPDDFSIEALKGRVILIEAFQMLCPGCVSHGLPQAQRVASLFSPSDVAVIGLHTVFEHFEAQGSRVALQAFAHEYRLNFPIGMDEIGTDGAPKTMSAYAMQGTPTLVLIDRNGYRRLQRFGLIEDLNLGAAIQSLLGERTQNLDETSATATGSTQDGCALPLK